MHKQLNMVADFQMKFGGSYNGPPRELPASLAALRNKLLLEECKELMAAVARGELEEQLDALVDVLYVLFGTVHQCGFSYVFEEAFERVHAANMQKIVAGDRALSKRDHRADVIKPEGWVGPDLKDLVTTL